MGFERAGFQIIWTNECDSIIAKLHSAGITSWRKSRGNGSRAEIFNTKPIEEINTKEIINEAFPNGKPKHFGIIGGPPCQDFSVNGSRKGFKGIRGKLMVIFIEKILELKPTFFLIENVHGLLQYKSHREFMFELLDRLRLLYSIDHKILNALDFGVPQSRERVFFIGIRKDFVAKEYRKKQAHNGFFPWPESKVYTNSLYKFNWPISKPFGTKISKAQDIPLELCVESCLIPTSNEKLVPNASEYFNIYKDLDSLKQISEGETNRSSFKRLHRFRYSPTACYGNNEVHLHPYKNRRLSVREALRIQSVPDEYVLPSDLPLSKKFKMIGNGVPVLLAEAVASSIKQYFIIRKFH